MIALVRHMGDIVACEPVARRVEELSPGAYVIWCVQRRYRELLTHNPHVAWAMGVSCLTEWRWLARSAAFNRAIDLHIDGQSCPVCCVPHVKPESRGVTMANYYQHGNLLTVFTKCAGLDIPQEAPRVYIDERTRHIVDGLGLKRDYVVLHCTTSHAERCWPREKWLELVEWLHAEEGLVTVEVGTEAVVPSGAGGKHHDLCGKLSVLGTAEVIRRGLLFVGLDSGPAHLANAMETAGVILLGRFNTFTRYLPYSGKYATGGGARLLWSDGLSSDIPVSAVCEAIGEMRAAAAGHDIGDRHGAEARHGLQAVRGSVSSLRLSVL